MSTPKQKSRIPIPCDEIRRLHGAGFSLLPLGGGGDGKSPLTKFKGEALPVRRVLGPMHAKSSAAYGVRLPGLAVIDCDDNDQDLVKAMEARFGVSPVHVRTPRGMHLYYAYGGCRLPNLRGEDLPVDIKRGDAAYVVGPHSIRPDGGEYIPLKGDLAQEQLPTLRVPFTVSEHRPAPRRAIEEGGRHDALVKAAIGMVEYVESRAELLENLQFLRDDECENPASLPDSEVHGVAAWAWSRRLEGKVYHGRNSEFRLHRPALDAMKSLPNASDAIALFVTLQDLHGHIPGKAFGLNHAGMRAARHTDLSRERFRSARNALLEVRLLSVAANHQTGRRVRQYRLNRLFANAPNALGLHRGEGGY